MNRYFILFAGLAVVCTIDDPASAQCCLGAQDMTVSSRGGRYRVEAKSLTGTGPLSHGPYHFRFSFQAKSDTDGYDKLHTFKLKWDTRAHFNMQIMVSPIGNAVAVRPPIGHLVIYSPKGEPLFKYPRQCKFTIGQNGYNIVTHDLHRFAGSGLRVEDSVIFLPLQSEVTKTLSFQSIWFLFCRPKMLNREREEIVSAIAQLQSSDSDAVASARVVLLRYGFTAIPQLDRALNAVTEPAVRKQIDNLLTELAPWRPYSGSDGWRNLGLTASMLYYPDAMVRKRARARLENWLEADFTGRSDDELHNWVDRNHATLQWNESKEKYLIVSQ